MHTGHLSSTLSSFAFIRVSHKNRSLFGYHPAAAASRVCGPPRLLPRFFCFFFAVVVAVVAVVAVVVVYCGDSSECFRRGTSLRCVCGRSSYRSADRSTRSRDRRQKNGGNQMEWLKKKRGQGSFVEMERKEGRGAASCRGSQRRLGSSAASSILTSCSSWIEAESIEATVKLLSSEKQNKTQTKSAIERTDGWLSSQAKRPRKEAGEFSSGPVTSSSATSTISMARLE